MYRLYESLELGRLVPPLSCSLAPCFRIQFTPPPPKLLTQPIVVNVWIRPLSQGGIVELSGVCDALLPLSRPSSLHVAVRLGAVLEQGDAGARPAAAVRVRAPAVYQRPRRSAAVRHGPSPLPPTQLHAHSMAWIAAVSQPPGGGGNIQGNGGPDAFMVPT